ncbi:hypothetical protein Pmar_PMAR026399 [Perkinsus marinus ATCC 50983]|uniref:Uncharacterized protein n=1 Tax=Perkinsus marinus (strain ATCC 50983 / TXsc) TaxID=423536 RepID=C5LEM9_PERM5|nr:hypothetical protein Pmar_PMAR026399 [Perkinsus marinus ATCC 50983]EER04847.1 hypothetical protein Pmar_PMAR026399 [Perkinsus marinus ATCC 50983]|eukprot:XP_002773031.1 hypothetical protein Pmar_PMAR026399 [Perkinsus marinus ATCC 50983]
MQGGLRTVEGLHPQNQSGPAQFYIEAVSNIELQIKGEVITRLILETIGIRACPITQMEPSDPADSSFLSPLAGVTLKPIILADEDDINVRPEPESISNSTDRIRPDEPVAEALTTRRPS